MSQQPPARPSGRPEFVSLIAVYQFITAGILLLLSCLIPAVLFPAIFVYVGATEGIFTGLFLATAVFTLLLGFGFASIVIGWGLLRLREWARLGAIVLAAFTLIGFPVWTIVSILILIYLTSDEARDVFRSARESRIAQRRAATAGQEMAAQAVYKAEPPHSAAEETRRMTYTGPATTSHPRTTNGAPDDTVSADETGAVPMPPDDPAWATENLYDQEADVSDHYRRWKASLEQESDPPGDEAETIEMPASTSELTEETSLDAPLSSDEGDIDERVWGPGDDQTESGDLGDDEETKDRGREA